VQFSWFYYEGYCHIGSYDADGAKATVRVAQEVGGLVKIL
jgi:hypothetical protein